MRFLENNQALSCGQVEVGLRVVSIPLSERDISVSNSPKDEKFPKTSRLLKNSQFRFDSFERYRSRHFTFYYTVQGKGRLGVSLSKKVLKNSVARNRVRRLLRETFRVNKARIHRTDVHVVGLSQLKLEWQDLKFGDVAKEFEGFFEHRERKYPGDLTEKSDK